MIAWLLLIPAATLFVAINIIVGCYVAVRLGYGPPDWKTALNLVVRVTMIQDWLNTGRDWLRKKVPRVDQFLDRLRVPKPIVIVEMPEEEAPEEETPKEGEMPEKVETSEEEPMNDETGKANVEPGTEQTGGFSAVALDRILDKLEPHVAETEQPPSNVPTE